MAILLGLNWLAILLYMEAVVSPFGTGVSFVAVTGRVLRAMEENGHIPKFLGKINKNIISTSRLITWFYCSMGELGIK